MQQPNRVQKTVFPLQASSTSGLYSLSVFVMSLSCEGEGVIEVFRLSLATPPTLTLHFDPFPPPLHMKKQGNRKSTLLAQSHAVYDTEPGT